MQAATWISSSSIFSKKFLSWLFGRQPPASSNNNNFKKPIFVISFFTLGFYLSYMCTVPPVRPTFFKYVGYCFPPPTIFLSSLLSLSLAFVCRFLRLYFSSPLLCASSTSFSNLILRFAFQRKWFLVFHPILL